MSKNSNVFQEVYPFTTEVINGYFPNLDFGDKTVLTVGSSLDHAFNALVLGAGKVVVYDINKNTEAFYKIKRDKILSVPREELYDEIIKCRDVPFSSDLFDKGSVTRMNNYLQSDAKYELLRDRLKSDNVEFVLGDIFNMDEALGDEKFDRIVFSNILQYLEFFAKNEDPYEFLGKNFEKWKEHLNDDGILQLLYLYSFNRDSVNYKHPLATYNLAQVIRALKSDYLGIHFFDDCFNTGTDAVVTYTKRG